MHLYTSLSGKANPLIKQVCPHSLRSVFFTNILPRGNLVIHLQLEEIMACWEWVGVGALFTCLESCFCCGLFFFFSFNSISELSSGKKYSESLCFMEGWDSVPEGFVFFRVSHFPFLWLRLACCFSHSLPSHSLIAFYFSFFLHPGVTFLRHTFVSHYSLFPILHSVHCCPG